jgi:hypothetical protein
LLHATTSSIGQQFSCQSSQRMRCNQRDHSVATEAKPVHPVGQPNRSQLLAADWLPTKWDWVDPLKDANAEIAQIEAGLKSRTQAIAERGYDAEQVDRDIAAERARERALGLDFRRPGSPAQGVQALSGQGEDEGKDEDSDQTDATDDAEERQREGEDQPERG